MNQHTFKGSKQHTKQMKIRKESVDDVWAPSITARESAVRTLNNMKHHEKLDHETLVVSEKDEVKFKTGSRYTGGWNTLGMAGYGEYTMFHGVEYNGNLEDGKFHGKGIMWYPNNSRVEGIWFKGRNAEKKYYFNDGLVFDEKNWTYCVHPDRRFKKEMKGGFRATGRTLLANRIPPRPIPPGCYDVGDGFYSPQTKCVTHPETGRILRIPPRSEEKWILENCRKSTGLSMFQPPKTSLFLDEEEAAVIFEQVQDLEKPSAEKIGFFKERQFTEEPRMVDKSTGRFDLLHKKVHQRAYNSKYIFIDEMRSRACKKHRLYLPALKVKTKVSIIPDLRVIPPFRCVHDSKAVLSNKMVLLLKMLKECDKQGGITMVKSETLKTYKKDFQSLLQYEKNLKDLQVSTSDISRISAPKDLSAQGSFCSEVSSVIDNISAVSPKKTKVLAFKEGDEKRSILKVSEHQAIRAKELATLTSMRSSTNTVIEDLRFDISKYEGPDISVSESSYTKRNDPIENRQECDVCLAVKQDKIDELKRKEHIDYLINESEKEDKRKKEIEELMAREKEIELEQEKILSKISLTSIEMIEEIYKNSSIDHEKTQFYLQNEKHVDLVKEAPGGVPLITLYEDDSSNISSITIDTIIECDSCTAGETHDTKVKKEKKDSKAPDPQIVFESSSSNKNEINEPFTDHDVSKSNLTNDLSDISELTDVKTNEMSNSTPSSRPTTPLSDMTPVESDYSGNETEGSFE